MLDRPGAMWLEPLSDFTQVLYLPHSAGRACTETTQFPWKTKEDRWKIECKLLAIEGVLRQAGKLVPPRMLK